MTSMNWPNRDRVGNKARAYSASEHSEIHWAPITFGPHKGKTLPQVFFADPDYFIRMHDEGRFSGRLSNDAECIYERATRIRPPGKDPRLWEFAIIAEIESQQFRRLVIIKKGRTLAKLKDQSPALEIQSRCAVLDAIAARRIAGRSKAGREKFDKSLRRRLLGETSTVSNRLACEAYFDDDSNFAY